MSFPLIRPGEADRLPFHVKERLRRQLAAECAAAAVRHQAILRARRIAEIQALYPPDPETTAARRRELCDVAVPLWNAEAKREQRQRRLGAVPLAS